MSDTVTLSRREYEDLIDARDHAVAMRDVATGAMETLGGAAYARRNRVERFWARMKEWRAVAARHDKTAACYAAGIATAAPSTGSKADGP